MAPTHLAFLLTVCWLVTACSSEISGSADSDGTGSSESTAALLPNLPHPEGLDFVLFGVDRQEVRLSDFRGKPVVLTFFYRSCPEANMCPMLMSKIHEVADGLAGTDAEIIAISFDPANDTPENLALFAESKQIRFRLLTGHPEAIAEVARGKFGIEFKRRETDAASGGVSFDVYDHNMKTFLIDSEGELRRTFPGSRWLPADVVLAVKKMSSDG